MQIFNHGVDEDYPQSQLVLQDSTPVPLSGREVRFTLYGKDGNPVISDQLAIVDDEEKGLVSYRWRRDELPKVGRYYATWKTIGPAGEVQYYPTNSISPVLIIESNYKQPMNPSLSEFVVVGESIGVEVV